MKKQLVLAIDIGTECIKTFLANVDADEITIQTHGGVLSQGFEKGEFFDPHILGEKIKQAVECTKRSKDDRINAVIVGLGGMQLDSQIVHGRVAVKSGCISDDDLLHVHNAACIASLPEKTEILQMLPKQYWRDGQIDTGILVGKRAAILECECLIVTVSQESLACVKQALKNAGIQPDYLLSSIFTIHKTVSLPKSSYLLLDIGAGTADFLICQDGACKKVGSLPIGGEYITRDIMQGTELDFNHAERLKRYFEQLEPTLKGQKIFLDCNDENIKDKDVQFDFLYDIINSRVLELVDILYKNLQADLADSSIECIYFTGGSSRLYNFLNALETSFGKTVQLLDSSEIPKSYRCPENTACFSLLQYVQSCLVHDFVIQQQTEEKVESQSFLDKIKNLLRL